MLGSAFGFAPLSRLTPPLMPGQDALEDWHLPEHASVTLRSGTKLNGTSPAITLSGSLNQLLDIRLEVMSTGTRGTADIRYSTNGGSSWTTVTTAATIALGSTGITANLPTGTYTFGDTWRSCVDFWMGRRPNLHRFSTTSIAVSPTVEQTGGNNGRSCFGFVAANQENFLCPNAGAGEVDTISTTLAGGNDNSLTVFCVFKALGTVGTVEAIWSFLNATTLNETCAMRSGVANGWNAVKRDTAALAVSQSGGTKDNNWHVGEVVFDGSGPTVTLLIDGAVILNAVAMDVGSCAFNVFHIGLYAGGVFADLRFSEIVMYRGALDAVKRSYQRARLKREHGIA